MSNVSLKNFRRDTIHQRARGVGELTVVNDEGRPSIRRLYQEGCAKIRIPKSRSTTLEAVIINTSGGVTGGDKLDWNFTAEENTNLSVTTQACERVYKSSGGTAQVNVQLDVQSGASLNWLPQETILFDHCSLQRKFNINLAKNAELLMVEPLIFGRQAMGETELTGFFHDRWRIRCDDQLLHAEDFRIDGNITERLAKPFVANGNCACATILLIAPRAEGLMSEAQALLQEHGGVSFWNGKLLARIIGNDGYELRQRLYPLIELLNDGTPLPKIWAN